MKKIICVFCAVLMILSLTVHSSQWQEAKAEEGFRPALDSSVSCQINVIGGYSNFEALEAEFDRFNEYYPDVELMFTKVDDFNNMIRRINQKMYGGKYERSIFKDLGIFDYEGKMLKAKFLGCKRYLCSKAKYDKKKEKYYLYHESTVAGMKKGTLQAYCKAENKDIYESFTNGLCLDLSFSKKLTSIYTDEPFEAELTDYRAHKAIVKEQSCVALIEIPFKLTMDHIYLAFLDEIKKSTHK